MCADSIVSGKLSASLRNSFAIIYYESSLLDREDEQDKLQHGQEKQCRDRREKRPECFQRNRVVKLQERDSNTDHAAAEERDSAATRCREFFPRKAAITTRNDLGNVNDHHEYGNAAQLPNSRRVESR